ncbi:hypothetical protein MASR2M70_11170 [Bacillota bacterium]
MFKISPDECTQLNQIVLQSYLFRESKKLREAFLTKLSELISFDAGIFFLEGRGGNSLEDEPVYINLMEEYMKIYANHLVERDEIIPYITTNKPFHYRATDLVVQNTSDVFNSFLRPQGLQYAQGMNLVWGGSYLGAVVLFRAKGESDFLDKELFFLSQFQSHLSLGIHEISKKVLINDNDCKNLVSGFGLTLREAEIVDYILCGSSNKEICGGLHIQNDTVKTHLKSIYRKLGAGNRSQVQAILMGLRSDDGKLAD